ncbi:MAG: VWA domain-containing protein [Ignavibacteriales bacterium]|nr:VWA domain-containing protein [Ignavibacteriales bacterium]
MVDLSGSQMFGSLSKTKQRVAAELSAILAFSALKNNDKVGLILFTDKVEKFVPPRKGNSHVSKNCS